MPPSLTATAAIGCQCREAPRQEAAMCPLGFSTELRSRQSPRAPTTFETSATNGQVAKRGLKKLKVMNNGVFKSPVHMMATNVENERISLAMCALKQRSNQQLVYGREADSKLQES
ncbi:hypothetical protein U9M48_043527 [Paspalum notatum var. saurae]|uniref:Uncharacterized protein n=1 Tax=Paspalum notatum var. saurae TaxID=547442 RepID=A0AAQ3UUV2_PASNO